MIDTNGFNIIQAEANKAKSFAMSGQWLNVFRVKQSTGTAIYAHTSNFDYYNVLAKMESIYPDSLMVSGRS